MSNTNTSNVTHCITFTVSLSMVSKQLHKLLRESVIYLSSRKVDGGDNSDSGGGGSSRGGRGGDGVLDDTSQYSTSLVMFTMFCH